MTRETGKVKKGWGEEVIWVTNDKYCSKFMNFNEGAKFSMHFHSEKEETWYVMSGRFLVLWINTNTSEMDRKTLRPGDIWHNKPLQPHQLYCEEEGTILEVSTPDSVEDNYRVMPGDSQSGLSRT
jgi:mannose-6-phosphate isomerase